MDPEAPVHHRIVMQIDGETVETLADVLPDQGPMRMLIVGKTPSPVSVEAGHYFQGRQGKGLWRRLEEAGLLAARPGEYHDDLLVEAGYGVTDVAKRPRPFGREPGEREYREGWERVAAVVERLRPRIVTFVYRGALDKVLRLSYGWEHRAVYGFNDELMRTFGRRVFVFPMPGTACTLSESRRAMSDLAQALSSM